MIFGNIALTMHSLLERQLRKAGFDYNTLPTDPVSWREFLARIEHSYTNADRQRQLLEGASPKQAIQATTLQLQTVMAAISDGLCVFDNRGHLLFINESAENYLNLKREELQQILILERFELYRKGQRVAPSELLGLLAEGMSFRDHHARLRQTSHYLPVSLIFNPIIENNQVTGSILLFSDISEVKTTEEELIKAKEIAEQASRAKSQFLSSMSHELRTPMNAILGYGELLKEDLSISPEEFESEDMLQYIDNILHAGWHLLELINKVLDLTRIESGRLEVLIEKVELIDLIKECISILSPQAEKRSITIENATATLFPVSTLVDRGRLKQVLINLLSNAVKYNREAGKITIRLAKSNYKYVRLEIIDTGIGLTKEQQAKVFDPFTRLSGSNLIEGTGIGLTITKELIELMDGRIGVESEINVGSNFWIDIPTGQVVSDTENTSALVENKKYILLYIEDNRTNVSLVAQILKTRPDIALISAHTGEMGLELANLHHPDVILLDINLPGMDGFEVLEHLRKEENTRHTPVLALTANDTGSNLERGLGAGFFNYIIKPLDIKNFLESIEVALDSSLKDKPPKKLESKTLEPEIEL